MIEEALRVGELSRSRRSSPEEERAANRRNLKWKNEIELAAVADTPACPPLESAPARSTPDAPPSRPTAGAPDDAPAKRRRGAQPGNVLSLKTGRHTARAIAERAEDRDMLKEVRALCAEVDELTARKTGSG